MVELDKFLDSSDTRSFLYYNENKQKIEEWLSDQNIDINDRVTLVARVLRVIINNNLFKDFYRLEDKISIVISQAKTSSNKESKKMLDYIYLYAAQCCYMSKGYIKSFKYLSMHNSTDKSQNSIKFKYITLIIKVLIRMVFITSIIMFGLYLFSLFLDYQIRQVFLVIIYLLVFIELCLIFYTQSIKKKYL